MNTLVAAEKQPYIHHFIENEYGKFSVFFGKISCKKNGEFPVPCYFCRRCLYGKAYQQLTLYEIKTHPRNQKTIAANKYPCCCRKTNFLHTILLKTDTGDFPFFFGKFPVNKTGYFPYAAIFYCYIFTMQIF